MSNSTPTSDNEDYVKVEMHDTVPDIDDAVESNETEEEESPKEIKKKYERKSPISVSQTKKDLRTKNTFAALTVDDDDEEEEEVVDNTLVTCIGGETVSTADNSNNSVSKASASSSAKLLKKKEQKKKKRMLERAERAAQNKEQAIKMSEAEAAVAEEVKASEQVQVKKKKTSVVISTVKYVLDTFVWIVFGTMIVYYFCLKMNINLPAEINKVAVAVIGRKILR